MDIQANQIAAQNHVDIVTNNDMFMFTSENDVTSGVFRSCTSSLGVGVAERSTDGRKFN